LEFWRKTLAVVESREGRIAAAALAAILLHLVLRAAAPPYQNWPLFAALALGGLPIVWDLTRKAFARDFGSDLLAGISIVTAVLLGEYLVGAIVVLMLSGGEALENYAVRRASSVLDALARRMPSQAHRKTESGFEDIPADTVRPGDELIVLPHEICPVDGEVSEGHGSMDESYLTGEPFVISKTPGSAVLSGAINGEAALTVRATRAAVDSRYAKIMRVMQEAEQNRPRMRRLADRLGAWYTVLALAMGFAGWAISQDPKRFLAVMVIATPCPLLIAVPVAIIGAISLAAKRGMIVRNPAALEQISQVRTLIFDKTGTLTYGRPTLTEVFAAPGVDEQNVLRWAASIEQYSKHPLAGAIVRATAGTPLPRAAKISERPGEGLTGEVEGRRLRITGRDKVEGLPLPPLAGGLECVVLVDGAYAGTFRFRDEPREASRSFVGHLAPRHAVLKTMLVSGDRKSEVRYLAEKVGIRDVFAEQSPEQKLELVRRETALAPTLFLGDGINDAPAMTAATVGIAFGHNSDVTAEAADAVVLDTSLEKVDELMHIGGRMRRIALQSAVGGIALSFLGMVLAVFGFLPPLLGAVAQEFIDLATVLNAVRVSRPGEALSDFEAT
jgi:heavy metal translocating P-type ATPase